MLAMVTTELGAEFHRLPRIIFYEGTSLELVILEELLGAQSSQYEANNIKQRETETPVG